MNNLKNLTLVAFALTSIALAPSTSFAAPAKQAGEKMEMKMEMKMGMAMATTSKFKGVEVNAGTASLSKMNGRYTISLSSDFMIPNTPAPHFQIVDGKGNTYLLSQLKIAGDKTNRSVTLPSYIKSVAKVQIWCSFAEVNLGEASFAKVQTLK